MHSRGSLFCRRDCLHLPVMKLHEKLRLKVREDLGLDQPFVRGKDIRIRNCWHFTTDGNSVDWIFMDEEDFIDGMNRVYLVASCHSVIILAFVLMDNHVHFILHGESLECRNFMHDYVKRTSMAIKQRHGISRKLEKVPVHFQMIDTDRYLKTAVCYVLNNPLAAHLQFTSWDYPWGSGSLCFRTGNAWTSPRWLAETSTTTSLTREQRKTMFKTNAQVPDGLKLCGRLILPSEYVHFELVKELFRTHRSFCIFLGTSKESDVESRGGEISRLSLPDHELRKFRDELCLRMFGRSSTNSLSTRERILLARAMKRQFNSSTKQLARLTGLVFKEVAGLL